MRRLTVVALALALAACGSPHEVLRPHETPTGPAPLRSTGSLRFLSPAQGARVPATHVRVTLQLTGARIIEKTTTQVTPDTGHVHLTLDGRVVSMLAGLDVTLNDIPGIGTIARGPHILQAEFVEASHAHFDPRVIAQLTFTAV